MTKSVFKCYNYVLRGNTICKPMELIFQQAMESGSFTSE